MPMPYNHMVQLVGIRETVERWQVLLLVNNHQYYWNAASLIIFVQLYGVFLGGLEPSFINCHQTAIEYNVPILKAAEEMVKIKTFLKKF